MTEKKQEPREVVYEIREERIVLPTPEELDRLLENLPDAKSEKKDQSTD